MVRIETDIKLDYKDVLIRPKRSTLKSRSEVDLVRSFICRNAKSKSDPSKPLVWEGVPIMVANMDATGTFAMATALAKHKCVTVIIKAYTVEDWVDFASKHPDVLPWISACAGTSEADFTKVKEIIRLIPEIRMVCLDAANAYTEPFVEAVRQYRKAFPFHALIAGNVVTGEMVEELILSGADIVKVGIGPGSVCTTRTKTGVGYPQLSAVLECSDAAHGLGGLICADGGTTCPGDFAKAFGGGADFVMSGGVFAGHSECGGEIIEKNGKKYLEFYGMSSTHAMQKHHGGVAEYRASEGKAVLVPFKGPVEPTILDILGGIRSTCTYVGASKLKELSKRTTFVRVTQQVNTVFEGNIDTTKIRDIKSSSSSSSSSSLNVENNGEETETQHDSKRTKSD